jgi:hypothetical protein
VLFRYTKLFVALGLLIGVWVLANMRRPGKPPVRPIVLNDGPVKILRFYANTGSLNRGEKTLLCYGVENARTVKITPDVEPITPSFNRCLEISPTHTTHYTLIAEGFDGKEAAQSVTVPVTDGPPPPPQILHFAGTKKGGRLVELCYQVTHAEKISVDPPVIPPTSAPLGCFGVEPAKTTTYTLTVRGTGARQVKKQVVVEVDGA